MIIVLTLIITLTAAFTLPSPTANAAEDNGAEVTPQITQSSKQDKLLETKFTEKAKEIVEKKHKVAKEKLTIGNERKSTYQYSGKKSQNVKVVDENGNIYRVALSDDGEELDPDALVTEDYDAKHAKYSKFEPGFAKKLESEPEDKPVKATISLVIPPYEPVRFPELKIPGSTPNEKLLADLMKQNEENSKAHEQPVIDKVIAKLKDRGYTLDTTTGTLLFVDLPPKVLKEIQTWEEISDISAGSIQYSPRLASARPAAGITAVNNRTIITNGQSINLKGDGIKVAQIESGGNSGYGVKLRMDNTNLPWVGIAQETDTNYTCPNPSNHSMMVAGILKSANSANLGVSPNISLWAGGDCRGTMDRIVNRAENAVTGKLSNIVNLSLGCNLYNNFCTATADEFAKKLDQLVYANKSTIVVSAANDGVRNPPQQDGTGKTYSIANAYNVITVGSYDDKNTSSWDDDTMSDFSNWVNPNSGHQDLEKPEVVAPGSSITSTGFSPDIVTDQGTSYAAPIVAGGAALLMQRQFAFKTYPEALKALIIATARNNVGRDGEMPRLSEDSKDGFGGVDFDLADQVMLGTVPSQVYAGDFYCASTPSTVPVSLNITSLQPHRVITTWAVNPYYPYYATQPNMDLDIRLYDPSNRYVDGSYRYDGNVEGIYFTPTQTGTYRLDVIQARCENTQYNTARFAVAYSLAPNSAASTSYIASYYTNKTLTYPPRLTRFDPVIDFDWGNGSPDPAIPADGFSVRWAKTTYFKGGNYVFTATADDGIRLYIDNVLVLDKWYDQAPTTYTVTRNLSQGNHTIKYEYYENAGGAVAKLSYQEDPVASGTETTVTNKCSGKVLDVAGISTADGANVYQWSWTGGGNQKWIFDAVGNGFYRIIAQHSGKVLDVAAFSLLDGGNIQQWTWVGGTNQQWSVLPAGNGYYKIISRFSGKALDVSGGSTADGANVQQWTDNGTCSQQWTLGF